MYLWRQLLSTMGPSLCIISSRAFNNNKKYQIMLHRYKATEIYWICLCLCACVTYLFVYNMSFEKERNEKRRKCAHTLCLIPLPSRKWIKSILTSCWSYIAMCYWAFNHFYNRTFSLKTLKFQPIWICMLSDLSNSIKIH